MSNERLPRHERVDNPPRMRLTERDVKTVLAVYDYRVLRREQIQQLFFPSKNTANDRLNRLYQHGFLERRWLPVEYGQGMGQALYLLAERGADLVVEQLGIDRAVVGWKQSQNQVGAPFLEHRLMVNQVRIAFTLGAERAGYVIDRWVKEEELKAVRDYVTIRTQRGSQRRVAVIPDGYFVLNLGDKRAHFFLEVDRATEANKRWAQKVQSYLVYTQSGGYEKRFQTRSLRVLTVTTSEKRLGNLKRTTEEAGGGRLFWFATLGEIESAEALIAPIWKVSGLEEACAL
jgi:hypothetical protein